MSFPRDFASISADRHEDYYRKFACHFRRAWGDGHLCIAGNTAAGTPSAYNNRAPVRAFDGSGIAADGSCGVTADNEMFMLSARSEENRTFPWYIQLDLGKVVRLDGVKLYNFNFAAGGKNYTERGVREFKLYVSTGDAWKTSAADIQSNYSLVLSNRLARATGTADYEGEYFSFDSPAAARYVALVALDDWDDSKNVLNYNGISEIQLFPVEDLPRFSVCCVGDSITEGANSSEAANKWTYRTYLAQMLAESGLGDVEWKGSLSCRAKGGADRTPSRSPRSTSRTRKGTGRMSLCFTPDTTTTQRSKAHRR